MAHFKPIFHVAVAHNFFADGRCTALQFVPTQATQRVLQQYQLMMRTDDTGFALIADQDFLLPFDEDAQLRFEVYSRDTRFEIYTQEVYGRPIGTPLYCSTRNITADNSTLVIAEQMPAELREVRSRSVKPGSKSPLLVLDIDLSEAQFGTAAQTGNCVEQSIQFHTRELYWKYYFFGELAKSELEIHDLTSQAAITFYKSDEIVAKNGIAFISQAPIAMNSSPIQRFQLKDKNNAGKILIKRLPNAGVNLISKSRDLRGQQIHVAEIYVNH
jgi:hypothetical protein